MARRYWLMKSEPEVFSIQHLARASRQTTFWDGVRNYRARNFLRDDVQEGDGVLFYHSNAKPPAVAGTAIVVKTASPDPAQFDPKSEGFDRAATKEAPRWYGIDVKLDIIFARPLPLDELKTQRGLEEMMLFKASRLSVQPVTPAEWKIVVKLGGSS